MPRLLFLGLLFLASCGDGIADYQPPQDGVSLQFSPQMGSAFLANRSVDVLIGEQVSECQYRTAGMVRFADLAEGTRLTPGQTYNLSSAFILSGTRERGRTIVNHMLTPKAGARYEMILRYERSGYGVELRENGRPIPFERPCLSN